MDKLRRLRELAVWYREFAERAGNPWIWEARLVTAMALEDEAGRLDRELSRVQSARGPGDRVGGGEFR